MKTQKKTLGKPPKKASEMSETTQTRVWMTDAQATALELRAQRERRTIDAQVQIEVLRYLDWAKRARVPRVAIPTQFKAPEKVLKNIRLLDAAAKIDEVFGVATGTRPAVVLAAIDHAADVAP